MILKKITFLILLSLIITNTSKSDFKEIKKKAIINKLMDDIITRVEVKD